MCVGKTSASPAEIESWEVGNTVDWRFHLLPIAEDIVWNLKPVKESVFLKQKSTFFDVFIERILQILHFFLLIGHITFIDLHVLNHLCIPGITPTWSWCMILLKCCWFQFISIFLRILHLGSSGIILTCSFLILQCFYLVLVSG